GRAQFLDLAREELRGNIQAFEPGVSGPRTHLMIGENRVARGEEAEEWRQARIVFGRLAAHEECQSARGSCAHLVLLELAQGPILPEDLTGVELGNSPAWRTVQESTPDNVTTQPAKGCVQKRSRFPGSAPLLKLGLGP